jgi:hypothetical protein
MRRYNDDDDTDDEERDDYKYISLIINAQIYNIYKCSNL